MEFIKKILHIIFILILCSSLNIFSQDQKSLKEFTLEYIKDLTSNNWEEIVVDKYGWDDTKGHKEFREAFSNYKIEIIHIVTNDTEGIFWGKVTAKHMKEFPHVELKGFPPTGKEVSWMESWYFKKTNGKAFDVFDMMIDGVGRMYSLGIKCLPE